MRRWCQSLALRSLAWSKATSPHRVPNDADTATLGKRAGKDAAAGKSTLPAIIGIEASRGRAEELLDEALAVFAPLGPRADALRALARYVLSRKK